MQLEVNASEALCPQRDAIHARKARKNIAHHPLRQLVVELRGHVIPPAIDLRARRSGPLAAVFRKHLGEVVFQHFPHVVADIALFRGLRLPVIFLVISASGSQSAARRWRGPQRLLGRLRLRRHQCRRDTASGRPRHRARPRCQRRDQRVAEGASASCRCLQQRRSNVGAFPEAAGRLRGGEQSEGDDATTEAAADGGRDGTAHTGRGCSKMLRCAAGLQPPGGA
mmetsp:Transcript_56419/g.163651  ORF Transcript_56419/g.163651 Transcript_56419/m.163651 type:complete len:225 (-) Transcript_56419:28-702(-)